MNLLGGEIMNVFDGSSVILKNIVSRITISLLTLTIAFSSLLAVTPLMFNPSVVYAEITEEMQIEEDTPTESLPVVGENVNEAVQLSENDVIQPSVADMVQPAGTNTPQEIETINTDIIQEPQTQSSFSTFQVSTESSNTSATDTSGPTIANKIPGNNARIGGNFKVSAEITDVSGINESTVRALFKNDSNREFAYTLVREGSSDVFSRIVNTREISTGETLPNRVSFRAVDNAGNARSSISSNVVIDNVGPTISEKNPASNQVISGVHTVSARVSDPSGVREGSVYARFKDNDGKEFTYFLQQQTGSDVYSLEVDTTEFVPAGTFLALDRVSFRAIDNFGSARSSISSNVVVDNTKPIVNVQISDDKISATDNGFTLSGTVVDEASAIDRAEYRLNRVAGTTMTVVRDWTALSAEDGAFDGTSESINEFITTTGLTAGPYNIQVRAFDAAGNESEVQSVPFRIDLTAPNSAMGINTPRSDSTTTEPIRIAGTLNDAIGGTGVDFTEIFAKTAGSPDSDYFVIAKIMNTSTATFGNTFEFIWTPTRAGSFDIRSQATDRAGNVETRNVLQNTRTNVTFVIPDTTAPTIEILTPAVNSTHNNNVAISVRAQDADSGLAQFVINIRDSNNVSIPCFNQNAGGANDFTAECIFNISGRDDGVYQIRTNVRDAAGNLSQTLTRSFTIDRTPSQEPDTNTGPISNTDGTSGNNSNNGVVLGESTRNTVRETQSADRTVARNAFAPTRQNRNGAIAARNDNNTQITDNEADEPQVAALTTGVTSSDSDEKNSQENSTIANANAASNYSWLWILLVLLAITTGGYLYGRNRNEA